MRNLLGLGGMMFLAMMGSACAERATDGVIEIALKDSAVVEKDTIFLNDVATLPDDVSKEMKELPIGNAPTPGHDRKISRMLVKARLVSSGFDMNALAFSGSDLCDVSLRSTCIMTADVVDAARKYITSCFPAGSGDLEVNLSTDAMLRNTEPLVALRGDGPAELRASVPQGTPAPGNVRVDVEVVQGGAVVRKVPVNFDLKLYKQVVVAQTAIAAGQPLTRANTALSRREMSAAHGVCFETLDATAGKIAATPLQPAQIITTTSVKEPEPPVVIEANQNVFLIVQTETLKVVTLGKALGRARRGEVAHARNLTTGREVVGVAGDDSTIHVFLGGPSNDQ